MVGSPALIDGSALRLHNRVVLKVGQLLAVYAVQLALDVLNRNQGVWMSRTEAEATRPRG